MLNKIAVDQEFDPSGPWHATAVHKSPILCVSAAKLIQPIYPFLGIPCDANLDQLCSIRFSNVNVAFIVGALDKGDRLRIALRAVASTRSERMTSLAAWRDTNRDDKFMLAHDLTVFRAGHSRGIEHFCQWDLLLLEKCSLLRAKLGHQLDHFQQLHYEDLSGILSTFIDHFKPVLRRSLCWLLCIPPPIPKI